MTPPLPTIPELYAYFRHRAEVTRAQSAGRECIIVHDETAPIPFTITMVATAKEEPELTAQVRHSATLYESSEKASSEANPDGSVTVTITKEKADLREQLSNLIYDYAKALHAKMGGKVPTEHGVCFVYETPLANSLLSLIHEPIGRGRLYSAVVIARGSELHRCIFSDDTIQHEDAGKIPEERLFRYASTQSLLTDRPTYQAYVELPELRHAIIFYASGNEPVTALEKNLDRPIPALNKYRPVVEYLTRQANLLAKKLGQKATNDDWDTAVYPLPEVAYLFKLVKLEDPNSAHSIAFISDSTLQFISLKDDNSVDQ